MQLSTLARLLGLSDDALIEAALLHDIVPKKEYFKALSSGLDPTQRCKEAAAKRSLDEPQVRQLLVHYGLDRVPRPTLRRAWTSGGGCRSAWGARLISLLDQTGTFSKEVETASEVPVVAAAPALHERPKPPGFFAVRFLLGVALSTASLMLGLLLDFHLPGFKNESFTQGTPWRSWRDS